MDTIAILGDSLLARHLLTLMLSKRAPLASLPKEIRLWSPQPPASRPAIEANTSPCIVLFEGAKRLEEAVSGAQVVINCHESRDWRVLPDETQLSLQNVDVPRRVLAAASPTAHLVHVSTALVQAGARWPNVQGKEQHAADYASQWPFMAYCRSRAAAESLVLKRCGPTLVVRVPLLYGEDDEASTATDLIKLSSLLPSSRIPLIGDGGGCMQFCYAGNVAAGVLRAAGRCLEHSEKCTAAARLERIVIVADETAIDSTYDSLLPLIQNGKLALSSYAIPFFLLFLPYSLLAMVIRLAARIVDVPEAIRRLPDPSLFYFLFHHWTFFSAFKASIFLGHSDVFSQEEALARSSAFYRKLDPVAIKQFSWEG